MKINCTTNQQSFGKIDVSKYKHIWFERLFNYRRYHEFDMLSKLQEDKPFDVFLSRTKNKRILASVYDKDSNLIIEEREKLFSALLNRNPVKFLYNTCRKAEETMKALGSSKQA